MQIDRPWAIGQWGQLRPKAGGRLTCTRGHDTLPRCHHQSRRQTEGGVCGNTHCGWPSFDACTEKHPHINASKHGQHSSSLTPIYLSEIITLETFNWYTLSLEIKPASQSTLFYKKKKLTVSLMENALT